jgi:hypothetical protein
MCSPSLDRLGRRGFQDSFEVSALESGVRFKLEIEHNDDDNNEDDSDYQCQQRPVR